MPKKKPQKHEYSKPRKEQMHEYDPLSDDVSESVEEELLSVRNHESADKPTKPPKKTRSGPKESYRSLHR
ncbi:MAG TPA: hypothetical protein DCX32_03155 [Candidatus Moranbacteria bacterium]|nr:MAG: hypothetical protein UW87_C0003G0024 [Candidatus Moranbacteria bacterium GW2011_GWC2_45_10]KKT95032.1 MAG: hypothetical protein UW95_C0005G0019 [Parcubacteria group bacterium GW2011_GWC1_45_14]HAV11517.1 hypothetical protein [Candidatus Moranbacteria bacterium]